MEIKGEKGMQVSELALSKAKAEREFSAYKEELKNSKTQFNKDMLSLYAHMKHGGKVLDLWESMKLAGLNADGDPKLAIVGASYPKVRFSKESTYQNGAYTSNGGIFRPGVSLTWSQRMKYEIKIPKSFFPDWAKDQKGNIVRSEIETVTPVVPARIMNALRSHKLENYHILWEVEEWKPVPPKDPILMKRITPNMFLVLATWDLSPLERAVIRGRI